jgi:uncharacterized protein (DUF302 family)
LGIAGVGAQDNVFQAAKDAPLDEVYGRVYKALEDHRFFVVYEINLGRNLAGFAERWGADYNRNQLEGIRAMVVCNGWYTNQVSNTDPSMLALCPLHLTLMHKAGTTTVLFARPTVIARGSPAEPVLKEVEERVIEAIRAGLE